MFQQPFGEERDSIDRIKILNIVSKGYPHGGAEKIIQGINASLREKHYLVKTLASDLVGPAGNAPFHDYRFRGLHTFSFIAGVPIAQSPPPVCHVSIQTALFPLEFFRVFCIEKNLAGISSRYRAFAYHGTSVPFGALFTQRLSKRDDTVGT